MQSNAGRSIIKLLASLLSVPIFGLLGWMLGYLWYDHMQVSYAWAGISLMRNMMVFLGAGCLAFNLYIFSTTKPGPDEAHAVATRASSAVSSMISGAAIAYGLWLTFSVFR
jgi:hypothetical protein